MLNWDCWSERRAEGGNPAGRARSGLGPAAVPEDLAYLAAGSAVQREVFGLLRELELEEALPLHPPVLAGTVPLGLQVEGSDLDLLCEVQDAEPFIRRMISCYGDREGFAVSRREAGGIPRVTVRFRAGGWPVEFFGQPLPVVKQNGYRHMLAEARVLTVAGPDFARTIIGLKAGGMKTEPAFAGLLKLAGDPYEAVLGLERLTPEELRHLLEQQGL